MCKLRFSKKVVTQISRKEFDEKLITVSYIYQNLSIYDIRLRKIEMVTIFVQKACNFFHLSNLICFVCLFVLNLYVPVNNYGHVGRSPPILRDFT